MTSGMSNTPAPSKLNLYAALPPRRIKDSKLGKEGHDHIVAMYNTN